jgi:hypothetical protein
MKSIQLHFFQKNPDLEKYIKELNEATGKETRSDKRSELRKNALSKVTKDDKLWGQLRQKIEEIAESLDLKEPNIEWSAPTYSFEAESVVLNKAPKIMIVFCKMEDFSSANGSTNAQKYLSLLAMFFRHTCRAEKGAETLEAIDYQPIICIGTEDIMDLYEPVADPSKAKLREDYHYQLDLNLDHRIKYLDSSIWNRYVPLESKYDSSPFLSRLEAMLQKMIGWHEQCLYDTVPAVATLEFQTRMLLHSFISKAGNRGHNELVRPFKFHSETQMERRTQYLMDSFFRKGWENNSNLADSLCWNLLLVDDQGNEKKLSRANNIEYINPNVPNKEEIIRKLMAEDVKINEIAVPENDTDIVSQMLCKMRTKKGQSFDLILLDYLLGDSSLGGREYGHDFMQKLMEIDNQKVEEGENKKENDPCENKGNEVRYPIKVRRGPFGRHWIFPISSFPHAFNDKMTQLGLSYYSNYWHLSHGGDPICTPELFRFNLLEFMQQQVCVCFYDAETLSKMIKRYDYLIEADDLNGWVETVRRMILQIKSYRDQLQRVKRLNKVKNNLGASLFDFLNLQQSMQHFEDDFLSFLSSIGTKPSQELIITLRKMRKEWSGYVTSIPEELESMIRKMQKHTIYLSWSWNEQDVKLKEEIEKHLRSDTRIIIWDRKKIITGDLKKDVLIDKIVNSLTHVVLLTIDMYPQYYTDDVISPQMELGIVLKVNPKPIFILAQDHEPNDPICHFEILNYNGKSLGSLPDNELPTACKELSSKAKDRINDLIQIHNSKNW